MWNVSEVTDEAGFLALEAEWRGLLERNDAATPFQSWEWIQSWWRHHGRGQPWVLVVRDSETAAAVAIMPLFVASYRGLPFRRIALMGAPLSDYQDLIAASAADAASAARLCVAHLARHRDRWDFCDFADLSEDTGVPQALSQGSSSGLNCDLAHHRMCPYIPLDDSWETFVRKLGKNLRSNVGRRRRQLKKTFGEVAIDAVAPEDLPQAMEELFGLHNGRWRRRGVSGAFAEEATRQFHHEVARRFSSRGWLRLFRLRINGQTRAAIYNFQRGQRTYYYLSGFDPELRKYSLGTVTLAHAVEHAIGEGMSAFELLRGDETYKYEWRGVDRQTLRLVLSHGHWRSRLAVRLHDAERYIERVGLQVQRRLWGRPKAELGRKSEPA